MECVLDVDSAGREPQKQAAKNYHHDQPRNPELFRFEPIPLSFEPVEPGRCAPVLYSSAVRDMIDYSLRSCVERGVTRTPLQKLRPLVPADRRVSARVLRAPGESTASSAAARSARSGSGRKTDRRPDFQGVPQGVQKALRVDQAGRITDEQFYAWSERGQRRKEEVRPRDHLAGGIPAVAPRLENMKLRGR